jgi:hypothetical protein
MVYATCGVGWRLFVSVGAVSAEIVGRENPPLVLVPWWWGVSVVVEVVASGTVYPTESHLWKTCDHQVSR